MRRLRAGVVLILLASVFAVPWASGDDGPQPAEPPPLSVPVRRKVSELSRRAADQIDRAAFDEARRTLAEALRLDPDNSVCLYNLAHVESATGHWEQAVADLDRATAVGFTDFSHLKHDPAFKPLHDLPAYENLLARAAEITRRASQRIVTGLQARYGPSYLYAVDLPHKWVFAARVGRERLDALRKELVELSDAEESQIFSHPSDEFVRIVIAAPADFARIEFRTDVGGSYDDAARTIVVKRPGFELRHEFTHALHAADQHALGQAHPVWLSEGLATLYEETPEEKAPEPGPAASPGLRFTPADTWRLGNVQAAARHQTLIPLDRLFKLDRQSFTARADLAYGESGSLLLYLFEKHQLKRFYDAYTAGYATDPTGRDALERVTGMKLDALQEAWVQWLADRPVPPAPAR